MLELDWTQIGKLLLASVLGGAVGFERAAKQKPAGLRTNMFICIGATLFTMLADEIGERFGGEPLRIVAQLIPGIGFIGAGAIIRHGESVVGLTTAATLFVLAAIGMAIGAGIYGLAVFVTVLVLIVLTVMRWLEPKSETER